MVESQLYTQFIKEMEGKDEDAKGLTIGMRDKRGNLFILGGWRSNLWQLKNGLYAVDGDITASPETAVESYNKANGTSLPPDHIEKYFEPWYNRQIEHIQVPSRTSDKIYVVDRYPDGKLICNCQGFMYRNDCWHVQAVKELTSGT